MTERNLSFRIGAQDDASRVFSKIAAAAKRDLGQVEDELDDGRTAGKRMADALAAVADELDRELTDTARAADRLGEALGPDLRAKVSASDLDKFVTDLRRAGLSIDEIEQDADELAAALQRVDAVQTNASGRLRSSFDDASDGVERLGRSTDQTRSVVANFAGNATQELPGVAGAMGPLNMAMGQFAEYATESNISLGKFLKAAGGLAVAGAILKGITDEMSQMAAARAFNRGQVDEWVDGIRGGKTAVEAMVQAFTDLGKVEFSLGGFDSVADFTPALAAAGVTMEQFGQLTEGSEEQLDAWARQMVRGGVDAEAVQAVVVAASLAKDQLTAATEAATAAEAVFADTEERTAAAAEKAAEKEQRHADAVESLTRRVERNTSKLEARRAKIEEVIDAQRRLTGEEVTQERALLDLADAEDRFADVQTDSEATDRDRQRALLDLFDAQQRYGQAVADAAEAQAIAAGDIEGAAEAAEAAQITALQNVAAQLDPDSDLLRRLNAYIWRLVEAGKPRHAVLTITEQRIASQDEGRQNVITSGKTSTTNVTINATGVGADELAERIGREVTWGIN